MFDSNPTSSEAAVVSQEAWTDDFVPFGLAICILQLNMYMLFCFANKLLIIHSIREICPQGKRQRAQLAGVHSTVRMK